MTAGVSSTSGANQGLRQGGIVEGLTLTATGRIVVEFADEVLVSDRPSDASHPPGALMFRKVTQPGIPFYDERPHRLASWQDGFVFLANGALVMIAVPEGGAPRAETDALRRLGSGSCSATRTRCSR